MEKTNLILVEKEVFDLGTKRKILDERNFSLSKLKKTKRFP